MIFPKKSLVVCIDDAEQKLLRKGCVYRVRNNLSIGSIEAISVEEIPDRNDLATLFLASRFRPIDERQQKTFRIYIERALRQKVANR